MCQLGRTHRHFRADFLQGVLIGSPASEVPLGKLGDSLQLLIRSNGVTHSLVFDGLEFNETQVFAVLPIPVGFLPDVDRRPIGGGRPLAATFGAGVEIRMA